MAVERVGTVPRYYSIVLPFWQEKVHRAEEKAAFGTSALTASSARLERFPFGSGETTRRVGSLKFPLSPLSVVGLVFCSHILGAALEGGNVSAALRLRASLAA